MIVCHAHARCLAWACLPPDRQTARGHGGKIDRGKVNTLPADFPGVVGVFCLTEAAGVVEYLVLWLAMGMGAAEPFLPQ